MGVHSAFASRKRKLLVKLRRYAHTSVRLMGRIWLLYLNFLGAQSREICACSVHLVVLMPKYLCSRYKYCVLHK